jgi:hypothetical protein
LTSAFSSFNFINAFIAAEYGSEHERLELASIASAHAFAV